MSRQQSMHGSSNTVIVGAGIIGISTAFYLSESADVSPDRIHVIETSPRLFASASGYAGGFLAKDWFSPAVSSLGALSFNLHKQLAEKYNGREKWGYCRSTGTSLVDTGEQSHGARGEDWLIDGSSRAEASGSHEFVGDSDGPAWLTQKAGHELQIISKDESVAQVDPLRLCEFLLREAKGRGVKLHHPAKATSLSTNAGGELSSIHIASENGEVIELPCDRLVITAGAWSPQVFSTLFPASKQKIPVSSYAGHSLVVKSPKWTAENEARGCHAVFTTDSSGYSPELFSRIGGEIYIAGVNDSSLPLPNLPTDSKPDQQRIKTLKKITSRLLDLPDIDHLDVVREGLCFRPVTRKGPPLVCRIPDSLLGGVKTNANCLGGVYISAGHGPWGISQSLGTGKVLSELIRGQKPSADINGLAL